MNLQQHFDEIDERGFTIVPNLVTRDEVIRMKQALKLALEEDWQKFGGRPSKLRELVVELVTRGPRFHRLLDNDVMHAIFSHFLTEQCTLYCYNSAIMPPNQQTLACSIHVDTNFYTPDFYPRVQLTLALDDFTLENGATFYLPGSHRSPQRPTDEEFYRNAVRTPRKAGDAVFFSTRCYHAGAVNKSGVTRYAVGLQACHPWMKQRFDYPRLSTPHISEGLSDRAKRFLGLYSQVPVNEEQFYVPTEQRLYKANLNENRYRESVTSASGAELRA